MALFTKKPKVVEGIQWNGDNLAEIQKLVGRTEACTDEEGGLIVTLPQGRMYVTRSHWVLKDPSEGVLILSDFHLKLRYKAKK